jgi:hypothetical protein
MSPEESYRQPAPVAHCHLCNSREVVSVCPRCGQPLCVHHLPRDDKHRCAACEDRFHAGRRRVNKGFGIAAAVLAAGCVAGFATGGLAWGLLAVLGTVSVLGTGGGVSHFVARRSFLAHGKVGEHQIELGDQRVAIGPRGEDARGAGRRQLSPRRGGHDPPSTPPERRVGYYG